MSRASKLNLAGIAAGAVTLLYLLGLVHRELSGPSRFTITEEYMVTADMYRYWVRKDGNLIGSASTLDDARRKLMKAREAGPERVVETIR